MSPSEKAFMMGVLLEYLYIDLHDCNDMWDKENGNPPFQAQIRQTGDDARLKSLITQVHTFHFQVAKEVFGWRC